MTNPGGGAGVIPVDEQPTATKGTNVMRSKRTRTWVITALAGLGLATSAAPAPAATPEKRPVFIGAVTVEPDGNASAAATFGAPAQPNFRYRLRIRNGPPKVDALTVTLNDQVVFQADHAFALDHATLPRQLVKARDNRLVISATGRPGTTARVQVIATRLPPRPEHRTAFRGAVTVEPDGNAVTTATFNASANPCLRYGLLIRNGGSTPSALTVTLNGQVVFQAGLALDAHRAALPRDTVKARDNRIVITAAGVPGSTARVQIVATRRSRRCGVSTGERLALQEATQMESRRG